ncbi:DUF4829 domain-containing protein [Clostridium sp.]|uniref:DUF4829 domain-containing protein n=1 Tax=Clostridium sp. TaxID=1506 RepID=UPI003216B0A8
MNKNIKRNILSICLISLFSFAIIGCSKTEEKVENSGSLENYQLELKNGTRLFQSEVTPCSEAEKVILDTFKIEINDKYDEFNNLYVDSEGFNNYPKTYKKLFDEGEYTENITIHNLRKLSEDEYSNNPNTIQYYYYMDRLNKYNPQEFEIIEVKYTVKLTDKANEGAQWGNGDWTRYYVVVKQNEKSNWRIFDIYGQM